MINIKLWKLFFIILIASLSLFVINFIVYSKVSAASPVVSPIGIGNTEDYPPYILGNQNTEFYAQVSDTDGDIDLTTCEYTINGTTWQKASYDSQSAYGKRCKFTITPSNGQNLNVNFAVSDKDGNRSVGIPITRLVDSVGNGPIIVNKEILSSTSLKYISQNPQFRVSGEDSVSSITDCEYKVHDGSSINDDIIIDWTSATLTNVAGLTADCEFGLNNLVENNEYLVRVRFTDSVQETGSRDRFDVLIVDSVFPEIEITDDLSPVPVQSDSIRIEATDLNLEVSSLQYTYVVGQTCNHSTDFSTALSYSSGVTIPINDDTHYGKYICVKASDGAGNTSYSVTVNPLQVDLTPPVLAVDNLYSGNTIYTRYGFDMMGRVYDYQSGVDKVTFEIFNQSGVIVASGTANYNSLTDSWTYPIDFSDFPGGPAYYDFLFRARDKVGRQSAFSIPDVFVDTNQVALEEVIAVPTPTENRSPSYTFSSLFNRSITWGGACSSYINYPTANRGNNTVTFENLPLGSYNNCTISMFIAETSVTEVLNISDFQIVEDDTPGPPNYFPRLVLSASPGLTHTSEIEIVASVSGVDQPLSLLWIDGNFPRCTGNNLRIKTPTTPGAYFCTGRLTDSNGDQVTASISVEVIPAPAPSPSQGNSGYDTNNNDNGSSDTFQNNTRGNIGSEENDGGNEAGSVLGEEDSLIDEILAQLNCDSMFNLDAVVFIDKNKNQTFERDDVLLSGVNVRLLLKDAEKYLSPEQLLEGFQVIDEQKSDSVGEVTFRVCKGDYELEVEQDKLPDQVDKSIIKNIDVEVTSSLKVNLALEEADSSIDIPYWLLILLAVLSSIAIIVLVYKRRKKEKSKPQILTL